MEEVRRSESSMSKIPVFPNGNTAGFIDKSGGNYTQGTEQKGLMRAASSDVQLSPTGSTSALNGPLAQGMLTAAISHNANELYNIQKKQAEFARVSPHRPDAASY